MNLFELLYDRNYSMGLLYCTKNLTELVIDHYLKFTIIDFDKIINFNWSHKKNNRVKHLLSDQLNTIYLFPNLVHLTFDLFNQLLDPDQLPLTLKKLTFGWYFNQPLVPGTLPRALTHLTFGYEFNKSIVNGVLPPTLIFLEFGQSYNIPLDIEVLPDSLQHLKFGSLFNQPIHKDVLPR